MRVLKHLFPPSAKRLFPGESLQRIAQAIAQSELRHTGEICFAVEPGLHPRAVLAGATARDRAHDVFAQLRVWDTQANNGVLLYQLLADHRIEIVADRGLAGRVSDEQWRGVCQLIEERLRAGAAEAGVLAGVDAMSAMLIQHFPRDEAAHDINELPDLPYIL
jgi:uncharacterized membrane protein